MSRVEPCRRVLMTGGRAPATLELARALADSGHAVYMAESFGWHLCRGSRSVRRNFAVPSPRYDFDGFIGELTRIIREFGIDILIPTCEEIFHIARAPGLLAECEVFCEPIERLAPLHDKWQFIELVLRTGKDAPQTRLIPAHENPREAIAAWRRDYGGAPFVLKPVFSRFAARVRFSDGDGNIDGFLPFETTEDWLIQEFAGGKEFSTFSVARGGRVTAHSAYPRGFTAGPGASIEFRHVEHADIEDWVRRFVAEYRFTGQIAFDLVVDERGRVRPLECNPRLTSGIHLLARPGEIDQAYFDADATEILRPNPGENRMIALAMLTYGLKQARANGAPASWRECWKSSRDVVFRRGDPLPLAMQLAGLAGMAWRALRNGVTMLEASTIDIEWNGESREHSLGNRMDRLYRFERHIFDITRPLYLVGRDKALRRITPAAGEQVLEIGVGTARNLLKLNRRQPAARYCGADVSRMMLEVARRKIAARRLPIRLELVGERDLDYRKIFDCPAGFDQIFCSFCLSMLEDATPVVAAATQALKPGGSFFIIDYYDRAGFPLWLDRSLTAMMRLYGVAFRPEPIEYLSGLEGRLHLESIACRFSYFLRYDKPAH